MNYLEYLDKPNLSEFLISEVYKSLENADRFPITNDTYKSFEATKHLKSFTKTLFDFEHNTAVQVIYKNVDIHVDLFRTVAYNYVVDTGGKEATTCFYDDSNNICESYLITPHKWHSLKVDIKHNVINITRPRIAITVHDVKEIPPEYRW